MKRTVLVLGGCRSGKSHHALALANSRPAGQKIFVATCVAQDEEMRRRVERHQQERGPEWATLEVPLDLAAAVAGHNESDNLILIDCLTLWISNLLMENQDADHAAEQVDRLAHTLATCRCSVILVSNEVGTGIVPENALARLFRDVAGFTNQRIAAGVDSVVWMVAGIPVNIKGPAVPFSHGGSGA